MPSSRLYTPPPGFYDLPYTYAFDASTLVNGNSYPNQQVYIQGGYGDFAVRRVVGLNRILAGNGTGTFQLMRASQGVYQSSNPVQAPNAPELAIVPEEWYPETGQIGFDLFGIALPSNTATAQIAFQGSRRLPGTSPLIGYKADPRTYTYIAEGNLTQVASQNARVVTYTPIDNYDFLLYQLMIFQEAPASLEIDQSDSGYNITLVAVEPGPAGNQISFEVTGIGTPNLPLVITVAGSAISVQPQTNGSGLPVALMSGLVAQLNANPAVAALVTITTTTPAGSPFLVSPAEFLTGGGLSPITSPVCSIQVFDQNQVGISNIPILDIFYNGAPGTPYENGAVVPPLMFRRNTLVEIDFYSQITNPALLPLGIVVYLIGRKLYPCG